MKEILHMLVVLSVICSVSGVVLASLKQTTRTEIENQVLTYVQGPALQKVFARAENNPILDRKVFTLEDERKVTVFPILQGEKLVGVGIEAFGNGYGGDLGVMVGFDVEEDRLAGIDMTTMSETPGLGTQITEPRFTQQFINHATEPLALKSKGGDLDGISGASYSCAGAVEAVQNAVKLYAALKTQILETWPN